MPNRVILHVDMDQFYAAVEIRDRPELRGKPVIIGADPQGGKARGVVSTASYEARKFGVHSAMPLSRAYAACPQGIFLDVDMPRYVKASEQINAVFEELTPDVEPLSLDEAFLDVSASGLLFGDGAACGRLVRQRILEATGLTASVGVASNKFVAKVASDLRKPDALVVVEPGGEAAFLAPLPVRRIWGVGPAMGAELARLGLQSIGQLAAFDPGLLRAALGAAMAEHLLALAQGLDLRPVERDSAAMSIGREHTFDEDTRDEAQLRQTLADLAEDVALRLRRAGLRAGTLTLKYRWEGFETHSRQHALKTASQHGPDIFAEAEALLNASLKHDKRRVRLLGLSASQLLGQGTGLQEDLFGQSSLKKQKADEAFDKVLGRYGDDAIQRANQSARGSVRPHRTGFSKD